MSEVMRYKTPANGVTDDAFPAEIREAAYQLWAYICDRNASRVARILNGTEALPESEAVLDLEAITEKLGGRELHPPTVQAWARREKWLERIPREFKGQAPEKYAQVIVTISAASTAAADYLRRVVTDESIDPKFRIDAAKTILDRAGHLPFNRPPDDTRPSGPSRDYSHAIAGKSTEDLARELFGLPASTPDDE